MRKTNKPSHLADVIREARDKHGLSQFALDDLAGFAAGTVSQYECGARVPSLQSIKCLAKALRLDLATLVELA